MANIAKWFEEMTPDEEIIGAVIGTFDSYEFSEPGEPNGPPVGKLLPWSEARLFLDYEYDDGYGGADCHPVFAWTASKILTVTEYDGATGPTWFPRNPVGIVPGFDGVP